VDFGIGALSEPHDDLLVEKLCRACYHVVFHKSHRFARREKISLNDLKDEPLLSMPPSSNLRRIFDGAAATGFQDLVKLHFAALPRPLGRGLRRRTGHRGSAGTQRGLPNG
jgi:DNA-binding transcriptional LysR family regulator